MRKSEIDAAVRDRWTVQDDFGSIGEVVGKAASSDSHVIVNWQGGDHGARVLCYRATRIEAQEARD